MSDIKHQTPAQRRHYHYMSDVMKRLEWDLHNTIELTDRIPEEWHEIAAETPSAAGLRVNLRLDADVVRFFKSMGEGYGPRINRVLKSYMHARLAGVIKGAETASFYHRRTGRHDAGKPGFGETARSVGEDFPDETPLKVKLKAKVREAQQQRHAEEGLRGEPGEWARVR
ncbi:hypothetical protein GC209_00070 [bacterium]|nr:hypothetical protein [bacterium]